MSVQAVSDFDAAPRRERRDPLRQLALDRARRREAVESLRRHAPYAQETGEVRPS